MSIKVKHIPVPILAASSAWEWKGFHLHIILFFCARAIRAPRVEPTALLITNVLCVINRLSTNVSVTHSATLLQERLGSSLMSFPGKRSPIIICWSLLISWSSYDNKTDSLCKLARLYSSILKKLIRRKKPRTKQDFVRVISSEVWLHIPPLTIWSFWSLIIPY